MKVTGIKQQVKSQGRYSVFVDGKFAFGLSESALLQSGLRLGQELSQQQLTELKELSKDDKAYGQALGLIARRPRSEWEIRDYYKRKGYELELVDQLIQRLHHAGWLNDKDFARRWVANRRLLKSTSRRRLQQELRAKRVADEIIQEVLQEDETDDQQVLAELVARKRQQSRYQDDQKLMAYLLRQGYNYGDIKSALSQEETD